MYKANHLHDSSCEIGEIMKKKKPTSDEDDYEDSVEEYEEEENEKWGLLTL